MTTVLEQPTAAQPVPAGAAPGTHPPATDARATLPWARSRRLALREFDAQDHDALIAMHQEPRLREYLVDDYPLEMSAVVRMFLRRMAHIYREYEGLGIWHASRLDPQPGFVGWFNLMPIAERPGEVEIGSRLLPQAWGGGLAFEGAELMLDHAFDDLALPRVWGICHPGNRAARAVLAALGFTPLGLMPYDGGVASHYRIDMNAWHALRNIPRGARLRHALHPQAVGAGRAAAPDEDNAHEQNHPPSGPPFRTQRADAATG